MRSLFWRIWLTVVAVLALFALVAGFFAQQAVERERVRVEAAALERLAAWADLLERSLPAAAAPADEQAQALREWSVRLRLPMALDDTLGRRIAVSDSFLRRAAEADADPSRLHAFRLDDGRTLWMLRARVLRGMGPMMGPGGPNGPNGPGMMRAPGMPHAPPGTAAAPWWLSRFLPEGVGLLVLMTLVFVGVAAGAWPVVRRLTRRLEALQQGVEAFGQGQLQQRVAEDGRDEVAALAASFNRAAARIEALLRSHQSLLANASHELRSPLARLKMALSLMEDAPLAQRASLRKEVDANIAELDALVEEVLLASRLDAAQALDHREPVELLGLLAAPHTSAGRMPTEIGLRLFVDGMMQVAEPTAQERAAIEQRLTRAGPIEQAPVQRLTMSTAGDGDKVGPRTPHPGPHCRRNLGKVRRCGLDRENGLLGIEVRNQFCHGPIDRRPALGRGLQIFRR